MIPVLDRLLDLYAKDNTRPVRLLIDSLGGECSSADLFRLQILLNGIDLETVALGTVGSAALKLYAMGRRRIALPHSRFYFHHSSTHYPAHGMDVQTALSDQRASHGVDLASWRFFAQRCDCRAERIQRICDQAPSFAIAIWESVETFNFVKLREAKKRKVFGSWRSNNIFYIVRLRAATKYTISSLWERIKELPQVVIDIPLALSMIPMFYYGFLLRRGIWIVVFSLIWIAMFGSVYKLYFSEAAHTWEQAMLNSAFSYLTLGTSPGDQVQYLGAEKASYWETAQGMSYQIVIFINALFGFIHLGIFVAYLYSKLTRR